MKKEDSGIMETKRLYVILIAGLLIFADLAVAQGTEEQRKYAITDTASFSAFICSSGQLGGFSMQNHSELTYLDLYLDTPDRLLLKNGLSLRFRKRMEGDSLIGYGFQLKNEMTSDTAIRMEVEETELDFYKVKTAEGWIPLTAVLDVFFDRIGSDQFKADTPEIQQAIQQLQSWIRFKSGSIVTPFQQLQHLPGFDQQVIQTLRPVVCGKETRKRSHIYIDPSGTTTPLKNIPENRIPVSEQSDWFREHPDFNWILESSLDAAVFYPLFTAKTPQVRIIEFETENKYFVPATGKALLDAFEKELAKRFLINSRTDSKYRTSMLQFGF